MSTLKERTEEMQAKTGWDDAATAKVAGVSRSALAQWIAKGKGLLTVQDRPRR